MSHVDFSKLGKELKDKDKPKYYTKDGEKIKLGTGAGGVVYHGLYLNQDVAIKIIQRLHLNEDRIQLSDEIKSLDKLSKCKCEYVIKFIDVIYDQKKDQIIVITELIKNGMDLYEFLTKMWKRQKQFTIQMLHQMINGLFIGLKCIHNSGIAHRDIKPSNIMVQKQQTYELKWIDFGLSCLLRSNNTCNDPSEEPSSCTKEDVGTPSWTSPEMYLDDKSPSTLLQWKQSDVYLLGDTIYFMINKMPYFPFVYFNKEKDLYKENGYKLTKEQTKHTEVLYNTKTINEGIRLDLPQAKNDLEQKQRDYIIQLTRICLIGNPTERYKQWKLYK